MEYAIIGGVGFALFYGLIRIETALDEIRAGIWEIARRERN